MDKIIHQIAITDADISGWVPPNKNAIETFFSDYTYKFWTMESLEKLLIKNNDLDVLDAINNIKPFALKADIARYYIVYKFGGWYCDLNMFFQMAPPSKHNYEYIVFADVLESANTTWAVYNGLFYFKKGHPILKKAIDQCVKNVKEKYLGPNSLFPTGPNVLGAAVASYQLQPQTSYKIGFSVPGGSELTAGYYFDTRIFAKFKGNGLALGESGLPGGNNYRKMWETGDIY